MKPQRLIVLAAALCTLVLSAPASAQPPAEPGFPMTLAVEPAGPPTIINVDRDLFFEPQDEIFYMDWDGMVHAINTDGTALPGWPVMAGPPVAGGAVAVADLNDDYHLEAVVGTSDGQVFAFDVDTGDLLPGYPVSIGVGQVWVTVAPVAAFDPTSQTDIVTVLVVGARPAGLEAALQAARRGYRVTLAEATRDHPEVAALNSRQREIIISTWNLIRERNENGRGDDPYILDNAALLSQLQETLRGQVETLAQRSEARQLTASDEDIADFVEHLRKAAEAMKTTKGIKIIP